MPDPLQPNKGAFMSALDWLERFGQVPMNLAQGRGGAAGRHALDILGEAADAALPGDLIPNASTEEDWTTGADTLGINRKSSPYLATAADIALGTAINPLTYTGLGFIGKGAGAAGKLAGKGARSLPMVGKHAGSALDALDKASTTGGIKVRSVFGAQRLSDAAKNARSAQMGAQASVSKAGVGEVERIMKGLTPKEREAVSDAIDNHLWKDGKLAGELTMDDTLSAIDRVDLLPDAASLDVAKIKKAVAESSAFGQRQWQESIDRGIFTDRKNAAPINDYLKHVYTGGDTSAATKMRELKTPAQRKAFLDEHPEFGFERDAAKRLSDRAIEQSRLAGKQALGENLVPGYLQGDEKMRGVFHQTIDAMDKSDPESAKFLREMMDGFEPRGGLSGVLAKVNNVIKPMMVYGYAMPKIGSIIRNKVGGIMQAMATPGAEGTVKGQAKRFFSDLHGAVAESLGKTDGTKLGKDLARIEEAFSKSGGVAKNAIDDLRKSGDPLLADMAESGILDGFVSSERLIADMARSPGWEKYKSVTEWPGRIFKGVEDRMRAGMYLDLRAAGKSGNEAAQLVKDALYDYSHTSSGNRIARDIIPFFQFTAKAIPQNAKFLSKGVMQGSPGTGIASAVASLTPNDGDRPIYPWMEGRVNIPVGADEQGNDRYVTGLGLPLEALTAIPNPSGGLGDFGRDVERGVVGSMHPLIKTAVSTVFQRDPFFGTKSGTYGKLPLVGEAGEAGRAINTLRGTGLTQPIESSVGALDKLINNKHGAGLGALDFLTGAKVESVDPDRALSQQMTRMLENNPDVQQFRGFYQQSKDPDTQAALKMLTDAKKRIKERLAAEQEKGSVL